MYKRQFVELPTVGEKREKGAFDEQQIQKLKSLAESGFPWADAVLMLCYTCLLYTSIGLGSGWFLAIEGINGAVECLSK